MGHVTKWAGIAVTGLGLGLAAAGLAAPGLGLVFGMMSVVEAGSNFTVLDPATFSDFFDSSADLAWAEQSIPFFHSDDPDLLEAYYL